MTQVALRQVVPPRRGRRGRVSALRRRAVRSVRARRARAHLIRRRRHPEIREGTQKFGGGVRKFAGSTQAGSSFCGASIPRSTGSPRISRPGALTLRGFYVCVCVGIGRVAKCRPRWDWTYGAPQGRSWSPPPVRFRHWCFLP